MITVTGNNEVLGKVRRIELIVVDDDSADVALLMNALEDCKVLERVIVKKNGQELIDFLNQRLNLHGGLPDLILLDLNMPKKNGRQVLKELKQSENLRQIPVIIFTSSDDEKDVFECYQMYANSYIKKPMEVDKMKDVVLKIEEFWFKTVTLVS